MVAAGIDYVTSLATGRLAGSRIVINMSLGDTVKADVIEDAIDRAIAAGVIVVASAGNEGEDGMGWPGAYPQVISAGASGWTGEWLDDGASGNEPANGVRYRMFWLQDTNGGLTPPLFADSGDVAEPGTDDVYVTDFSSREKAGQELDVLAPGSWVRGPFAGFPGYNHLPFWSKGISDLIGSNPGNFFYVGGTSMAAPHVTAAAALLLEKNDSLTQAQVESILKGICHADRGGLCPGLGSVPRRRRRQCRPGVRDLLLGRRRHRRRPAPGRRGDLGDAVAARPAQPVHCSATEGSPQQLEPHPRARRHRRRARRFPDGGADLSTPLRSLTRPLPGDIVASLSPVVGATGARRWHLGGRTGPRRTRGFGAP